MIKAVTFLGAAAFTLAGHAGAQSAVPAGDAAAGAKSTQMCVGCHGILGWRTAFTEVYKVPKLGGQHEAYIVKALQAYKSGERTHASVRANVSSVDERALSE